MSWPRLASKTDTVSSPRPHLLSCIAPSVEPLCKGKQIKKLPAPAFKNWAFRTNDNTVHVHSNSHTQPTLPTFSLQAYMLSLIERA